ncbi:30S ribosomal protein S5 [Candidatus Peregrinibacteria bacterium]|nr:30S ribosomal protein S5 [Candidatus Peregrinibacteria bacterium]MBI3815940.1 30S ribosomal protein S5 [Candidatus Peregrinibacteria bacterium]
MTAKTSRPDRKRSDRSKREPSEFAEATLSVDRVTRVVKGGRRMRFRAIVVVGNRKGKVGLGTGKASEVQAAVKKAASAARRAMIKIPIVDGTIPHQVETKFKAAKIRLLPAYEGTGIIAGGALRVILDHAGVKNVLSKRYGTRNKLVNAQTTMQALGMLRFGKESKQEQVPQVAAVEVSPGTLMPVTEMTRAEAEEKVQEARRLGMEEN